MKIVNITIAFFKKPVTRVSRIAYITIVKLHEL